ncbi:hypothetical protein ACQKJC_24795 [Priestia koreensis]|uniref:hypothetical protein n=1 Tax=Priestia koreensis TaxID=284581 RepID=UPI003D01F7C7
MNTKIVDFYDEQDKVVHAEFRDKVLKYFTDHNIDRSEYDILIVMTYGGKGQNFTITYKDYFVKFSYAFNTKKFYPFHNGGHDSFLERPVEDKFFTTIYQNFRKEDF